VNRTICALVSGGLDSCVMLAELTKHYTKVHPVFVRQGLVWEEAELRFLRQYLRALPPVAALAKRGPRLAIAATTSAPRSTLHALAILSFPIRDVYGDHWSTTGRQVPDAATPDEAVYLPGRNLLLLSKAAVFCAQHRIDVIAIGSLGYNPFPDATPKFFREFAQAAGDALSFRLRIVTPLRQLIKTQVIRRGVRLGLPLHLSFSCISPRRGRHCGRCNKCAERQRAFREAGVADATTYASR
jgi:7-cyano-7-deazaguanine synthase